MNDDRTKSDDSIKLKIITSRLRKAINIIFFVSSLFILTSFVGLFVLSEKKSKDIEQLQDSINIYRYSSTYILYHHYWQDDTLGKAYTRDIITEEGDTIKNRKYDTVKSTRKSHFTFEGIGGPIIHKHDTLKLNNENAKLIEKIIREQKSHLDK